MTKRFIQSSKASFWARRTSRGPNVEPPCETVGQIAASPRRTVVCVQYGIELLRLFRRAAQVSVQPESDRVGVVQRWAA